MKEVLDVFNSGHNKTALILQFSGPGIQNTVNGDMRTGCTSLRSFLVKRTGQFLERLVVPSLYRNKEKTYIGGKQILFHFIYQDALIQSIQRKLVYKKQLSKTPSLNSPVITKQSFIQFGNGLVKQFSGILKTIEVKQNIKGK